MAKKKTTQPRKKNEAWKNVKAVEKFGIVVCYAIFLGKSGACEFFGTWDNQEDAEKAKRDILNGNEHTWISEDHPVRDCYVTRVMEIQGHEETFVPVLCQGPYMGL